MMFFPVAGMLAGEDLTRALHKYGFMPSYETADQALQLASPLDIEKAVTEYQDFHSLKVDGLVGPVTTRSMCDQRICDYPDRMEMTAEMRGARWPDPNIRWTLLNPGDWQELSAQVVTDAFKWAFRQWELVCGIKPTYTQDRGRAHVLIAHGRIDQRGKVLAWSQLANGTMQPKQQRYDAWEVWTFAENPDRYKIDLGRVAAHEIGHVLGIPHISAGNLLQPTYDLRIRTPQGGDVREAVERYGRPTTRPDPNPDPDPGNGQPVPDNEKWVITIEGPGVKVTSSRAA